MSNYTEKNHVTQAKQSVQKHLTTLCPSDGAYHIATIMECIHSNHLL